MLDFGTKLFIQGIDENIYVFYTARNSFYIAFNVFTIEGEIEDFYYMSISQRKVHQKMLQFRKKLMKELLVFWRKKKFLTMFIKNNL